ncbi:MAG: hypothetical protein AAFR71_13795 [Pseudomonadota bacterium]
MNPTILGNDIEGLISAGVAKKGFKRGEFVLDRIVETIRLDDL